MAAYNRRRQGVYMSSPDMEGDEIWQDFHAQVSAQSSSTPIEEDFPQLQVARPTRSPSRDSTADGTAPPQRATPSKPLPPPPRQIRPPSTSTPIPFAAPPPEEPLALPLPMNPRTKSPLRPQGIRSNGISSIAAYPHSRPAAPLLTIPVPPPANPPLNPSPKAPPPLPSTPAPKAPPSPIRDMPSRSPSPKPGSTIDALELSPRSKGSVSGRPRPEAVQPHRKPLLKMSTEPVIVPAEPVLVPLPTTKQLTDPISRSQAEYMHYLNLASREDFTQIRQHNILYNAGKDREGRTIVAFVAHNIPATKIDLESLFLFAIATLDKLVESEYTLLYCHANIPSVNQPSFAYLRRVYNIFNRKYKKNLKKLFIVGSGFWVRMTLKLFKAFVSAKFWKKLQRVEDPNDLNKYFDLASLRLPDAVFKKRGYKEVVLPVFACMLADSLKRRPSESGLPVPVEKSVEAIRERFMQVEGIFRISGMVKPIESLRKSFDAGEDVDFSLVDDPHAVAGLLKLYLRELPEPLIPFAQYPNFVAIQGLKAVDEAQWERLNKQLLTELPWENRMLLRYLCTFLKVVSTFQDVNRMTIVNLSVCFGPNFMRPEQETMETALRDMPIVGGFCTQLITRCEEWLPPVVRPTPAVSAPPLPAAAGSL